MPFTGNANTNASQFLADANMYMNFQGWPDERKIYAFPMMLQERAKAWYNSQPSATQQNFQTLTAAFKTAFCDTQRTGMREAELLDRRMRQGESVAEYASDMMRRMDILSIRDPERYRIFTSGLRAPYKGYVLEKGCNTFSDAERHALKQESLERIENQPDSETVQVLDTLNQSLQSFTHEIQAMKAA